MLLNTNIARLENSQKLQKSVNINESVSFKGKDPDRKGMEYIGDIYTVPTHKAVDVKEIAKIHGINNMPEAHLKGFVASIDEVVGDEKYQGDEEKQLLAYKQCLRFLNQNEPVMNNPMQFYPRPALLAEALKTSADDYIQKWSNRPAPPERQPERRQPERYAPEVQKRQAPQRPQHVSHATGHKAHKKNGLTDKLTWGVCGTLLAGTLMAQTVGIPPRINLFDSPNRDVPAQVEGTSGVELPGTVQADSEEVIANFNAGNVSLLILGREGLQEGDRITFNSNRYPVYFDEENQVWGTMVEFSSLNKLDGGQANLPIFRLRDGEEGLKLGNASVTGPVAGEGEGIAALSESREVNPNYDTASYLIIKNEPFSLPVQGGLIHKFGDNIEGNVQTDNLFQARPGSDVVAPARTRVVEVNRDRVVLDGGWGLHFVLEGVSNPESIQPDTIIESGTKIGEVGRSGEVSLRVEANGIPTDFFGQ